MEFRKDTPASDARSCHEWLACQGRSNSLVPGRWKATAWSMPIPVGSWNDWKTECSVSCKHIGKIPANVRADYELMCSARPQRKPCAWTVFTWLTLPWLLLMTLFTCYPRAPEGEQCRWYSLLIWRHGLCKAWWSQPRGTVVLCIATSPVGSPNISSLQVIYALFVLYVLKTKLCCSLQAMVGKQKANFVALHCYIWSRYWFSVANKAFLYKYSGSRSTSNKWWPAHS